MTEEEKQKALDKANSYRQMFDLWAWKDFMSIINNHQIAAINDYKATDPDNVSLFKLGLQRGILKEIDDIRSELHFIVGAVGVGK